MKRFITAKAFFSALLTAVMAVLWSAHSLAQASDASEVSNEQMVAYYEKGMIGNNLRVVDSRPAGKYFAGHIPGAISLPLDALKQDPTVVDKLGIPKTDKVIFYCAGRECTLSVDSAEIFRKLGYTDVVAYRNGIPGWNQKMQPLLAEEPFIKKGNVILVDIAPGKETIVTSANKTVQISMEDLKGSKGKALFGELSKNAPLVVIERDGMNAVNLVLEELRDMDFRRLAYLPLKAWKEKLALAPAMSKLTWAPVYGPGQVSPRAFEEAVAAGKPIFDVRPIADFARGHFKGAVNLPIEELEKEFARIPKDQPVFVNCATGAKSQKAFDILGRKGYTNVVYLDAEINCKLEACTIKE